jgi:alkyl sulfatase BDS1-like metallo-beta-lactamase superfamily hydrolase
LKHLVFAQPDKQEARHVLADLLEQMGYQAESGPWRNFYLSGARELRKGVVKVATPTMGTDIVSNMSFDLVFGYMGIQLDAKKAEGKKITVNWVFPDAKAKYALFLENSVLNYWADHQAKDADVTLTIDRRVFYQVLGKQLSLTDALTQGKAKLSGDGAKLQELMGMLVELDQSFWFNIVTP